MNDEEAFQQLLDANPEDHTTRLVFADWLEERGDPRAEGYRALGVRRALPAPSLGRWFFTRDDSSLSPIQPTQSGTRPSSNPAFRRIGAKRCVRAAQPGGSWNCPAGWFGYTSTRREAEDAAALAFAKLPETRRAELLAGKGAEPVAAPKQKPKSKRTPKKKPKGKK